MSAAFEVNFDGLIGPTHNYAGLSFGNLASNQHRAQVSNPRVAALQGLAKMKFLADLGVKQGVLPPHERPDLATLRRLGFSGSDARVLEQAQREAPMLLASCCSASAMWAANAATVSPSADTADRRVHFTPANLITQFHRSLEPRTTAAVLRRIFPDESKFAHHSPLPAQPQFGDEGAANHMRLCAAHGHAAIEAFVYGRSGFDHSAAHPKRFPARQTREASESIARIHQLHLANAHFIAQNPAAIDAGAFHNDVVAVANENVLLYHAEAFEKAGGATGAIGDSFKRLGDKKPVLIEVPSAAVSLEDAVRSYLFNSQLVTLPGGTMALICPIEARETRSTQIFLDQLLQSGTPIRAVHFVDVRQSMNNGGGPACLRLRVVLTEAELSAVVPTVLLTDTLFAALASWVKRHYRESLAPADLADPKLIDEGRAALDELTKLLGLGALYAFQQNPSNPAWSL